MEKLPKIVIGLSNKAPTPIIEDIQLLTSDGEILSLDITPETNSCIVRQDLQILEFSILSVRNDDTNDTIKMKYVDYAKFFSPNYINLIDVKLERNNRMAIINTANTNKSNYSKLYLPTTYCTLNGFNMTDRAMFT